jgi:hypothetical protein
MTQSGSPGRSARTALDLGPRYLRAVALAYRRIRRLGARDLPARKAAEVAYRERCPTMPERERLKRQWRL